MSMVAGADTNCEARRAPISSGHQRDSPQTQRRPCPAGGHACRRPRSDFGRVIIYPRWGVRRNDDRWRDDARTN